MSGESANKKLKRISESDRMADYDMATQKALEEIDTIQTELDQVNEKASDEILQIERKYNRIRKPHFEKRNQVISTIPNFWISAMMNHPDLSNLFNGSNEEDCLHHLTKIEVDEFEDILSGYFIKFYFDENPYFENAVLTKEYHLGSHTPVSKSTQIIWKEGYNLGQNTPDANKPGRKRRLESMKHSFFSWFSDNVDPYSDDIAEDFKDDLWLNPLQYYLVADGQEEDNGAEEEEESSSDDNEESVEPENQSSTSQENNSSINGRAV